MINHLLGQLWCYFYSYILSIDVDICDEVAAVCTAAGRITSHLDRNACVPPPELVQPRPPVPDLNSTLLCDQQNLLFALHADFLSLVEHARCVCRCSVNYFYDY